MQEEQNDQRKAAREQLELSTSQQVQGSKLLKDAVEADLALLLGGDLIVTIERVGPFAAAFHDTCLRVTVQGGLRGIAMDHHHLAVGLSA